MKWNALHSKTRRESGETLAETLVSLLIASVSLVMLTSAITASFNIINRTKAEALNYKDATNYLVVGGTPPSGALSVTVSPVITRSSIGSGDTAPGSSVTPTVTSRGYILPGNNAAIIYYIDSTGGGTP